MNRFAVIVLSLAVCATLPSLVTAAEPAPKVASREASAVTAAPFGLEWASTRETVEANGIKLEPVASGEGSRRFTATGFTKMVAGIESIVLDFGFDNKLWKVLAVSEDYPNDPYGFKVKARYLELNEILVEKYGKGKATHRTGGSIYDEPRYFLARIMHWDWRV